MIKPINVFTASYTLQHFTEMVLVEYCTKYVGLDSFVLIFIALCARWSSNTSGPLGTSAHKLEIT